MPIQNYTNQSDILQEAGPIIGTRLNSGDSNLINGNQFNVRVNEQVLLSTELHLYTPDGGYVTGNHNISYVLGRNIDTTTIAVSPINSNRYNLSIDVAQYFQRLRIIQGTFKLAVNVYHDKIGSFSGKKLFIKRISTSRRELLLKVSDINTNILRDQFRNFRQEYEFDTNIIKRNYVLNLGFNQTYQIVNIRFGFNSTDPEIYVKLYEPLPTSIELKSLGWITEEIIPTYFDTVSFIPSFQETLYNTLRPANFDLEEYDGFSTGTTFKSWNDLLSQNLPTTQQLIDNLFSGSATSAKLNVEYCSFDHFVHFSSAEERVRNFKYKLELIENYTDRIFQLFSITGSITNLTDLYTKRNTIVSGFDDFEKYLFFEDSGSRIYTYNSCSYYPWPKRVSTALTWEESFLQWQQATYIWSQVTQSWGDPYPWFNKLYSTTDPVSIDYFNDLVSKAQIYDRFNRYKLIESIPAHVLDNEETDDFEMFVHMLGQHYDTLWLYTRALTDIYSQELHPKDGLSEDLIYDVAKSLGFQYVHRRKKLDLWRYYLGTNVSGSALQTGSLASLTDNDIAKETWKRVLNNLPYIYKIKGTARGIKALLSCYGIPSTVLTIKEYGGPSTFTEATHFPEYIHDVFSYMYEAYGTGSQYLHVPYTQYIASGGIVQTADTVEFRFRTDDNYSYGVGTEFVLCNISTGSSAQRLTGEFNPGVTVTLQRESNDNNEGTITLYLTDQNNTGTLPILSASINNLEIFDNSFCNLVLFRSASNYNVSGSSQHYGVVFSKAKYGKVVEYESTSLSLSTVNSASYAYHWLATGSLQFGNQPTGISGSGGNVSLTPFLGQYQEVRLWGGSLNENTIREHTLSPNTYTYNVDRTKTVSGNEALDPYNNLLQRYTLSSKKVITDTIVSGTFFMQQSNHPNQNINVTSSNISVGALTFVNYLASSSIQWQGIEETYYTPSPSLGGNSLYSNKVRIESSSISGVLNTKTRVERSSYDKFSLDSNKLGVYFSPQTAINEDIFNQLGYFEIDDYIGDPQDVYSPYYRELRSFSDGYWKKYTNKNDFEAYFRALTIYDFTFFKYLRQLIPARVNLISGLLVEPNVLERSKFSLEPIKIVDETQNQLTINLSGINYTASAQYENYLESSIEFSDFGPTVTGSYDYYAGDVDYEFDINQLHDSWQQINTVGNSVFTTSGSYTPVQTFISGTHSTETYQELVYFYSTPDSASQNLPYSSSYINSGIQLNYGLGWENILWNGSQLTGEGVNIDTANTTDGGPVVQVIEVNPNQLIFANNQVTTLNQSITGIQATNINDITVVR